MSCATLVEQTSAAAQHLRDQAQALENAASVFRLEAGAHDVRPLPGPKAQAAQLIARVARNSSQRSSSTLPAAPVASVTPARAAPSEDTWEQF